MLREDTVYLRLSSHHDLVDDATFVELLSMLTEWNRRPFSTYTNLAMRGRPRDATGALLVQELHSRVGAGQHQQVRFRLDSPEGPVASYEFSADAHPYTGNFHTQIDVRVRSEWIRRNPESGPQVLRSRFLEIASMAQPFQGHAHETDDNSIQNIAQPGLLRRGFGVEVDGPVDIAQNPGRELSRGEYRYVVNWLTLFGPAMIERLGEDKVGSIPVGETETLELGVTLRKTPGEQVAERMGATLPPKAAQWLLLQLGQTPLGFAQQRPQQAAAREHLALAALAEAEKWPLGYWQKKN